MCSKEFGITPRKIGSDRTPKDQKENELQSQLFESLNLQTNLQHSEIICWHYIQVEHYDIQSMNGSNITCNITFHGECFSCPSLSISKYCA